jgi:hypothetical protein
MMIEEIENVLMLSCGYIFLLRDTALAVSFPFLLSTPLIYLVEDLASLCLIFS